MCVRTMLSSFPDEPPLYGALASGDGAALNARSKNPNRPAGEQFKEPIRWCSMGGVSGHYEAGFVWGPLSRTPVAVEGTPEPLLEAPLEIPPTMVCSQKDGGASVEFFDFSGGSPILHVAAAGQAAVVAALGPRADRVLFGPVGAGHPSTELLAFAASTGWPIMAVQVGLSSEQVAHCLCSAGLGVSVDLHGLVRKHPTTRIQASVLKWVKDSELISTMSKFADSALADDCVSSPPALSWAGVVYDENMSVARTMMSWGALAAWTARNWFSGGDSIPPPRLEGVCEPLASYVSALFGVNSARAGAEVFYSDISLHCNSPSKMTAAQVANASALF